MGVHFCDEYSLLHLAAGIVAYFWNISIEMLTVLHIIFELLENTKFGVNFIDHYLPFWPGGKLYPDGLINSISDVLFSIIGWYLAEINVKFFKQWAKIDFGAKSVTI